MTALEASKSTKARADGFAALRDEKTACSSTSPMSQSARTRTSRPCEISFLATPKRRDEPEPSGARRPDLVEGDDQAAVDSHRGRLPLGERPRAPELGRSSMVRSNVDREQPMELHQVRYFLAVASTLNFTRAAEQCNITQPALTKGVQKL